MMTDYSQVLELATETERQDLELLQRAIQQTQKAYQEEFSAANKKNWDAAKDGLADLLAELNAKYFGEAPAFRNLSAVLVHLQDDGYKIQKTKLYDDKKAGLITVQPDGSVRQDDVLAYVAKVDLKKTSDNGGQLDALNAQEKKLQIQKLQAQTEKYEFDLEKEKGNYIPKSDARMEFAIKIGVFESGFKNLVRTNAVDWTVKTGGDVKKVNMLIELIFADIDELLNEMGTMEEIGVVIKPRPIPQTGSA